MLSKIVLKTIDQNNMISSGDTVLVGISGGYDSTALLHLLNSFRKILRINLYAAHMNHCIRGKDAEKDEQYTAKLAKKLGIKYISDRINVPSFAKKQKLSLEDAARRARYAFFNKAAQACGATKIAVAHNADDNVETFLMRLIRGSGPKGLEGIPKVRGNIIRPLMDVWRSDIEAYCKKGFPKIGSEENIKDEKIRGRVWKSSRNLIGIGFLL